MGFRFFDMFRAEPTEDSIFNQEEVQTMADAATSQEARRVVQILAQPRRFTSNASRSLRAAVNGNNADYLYSRFGNKFGWGSLQDAQKFYDQNKRGTDGWGG